MVARDALVPRVAREDDVPLVRATSLQETLQNTAQFVGPLAAGLLIAAVAEQGTLLVAAVMFAAAMALIAGLERQRLGHDQPLTAASALADVRQGFRFIVTEPLLGPLTWLLVAWVAVYVPLSTLIFPAWFNFARESAGALGLFLGVQALGGVLGGLPFSSLAFGWLVNATARDGHRPGGGGQRRHGGRLRPGPAMRLVDAPAPARER
jgi:hypothetical protein